MKIPNEEKFFETLRLREFCGRLVQSQVDGINELVAAIPDGWDLRWAAYLLATVIWETGHTMQPVREAYWLTEDWRRTHLRYYPYYGRGYVQLTWRPNYLAMGTVVGMDLVGNPDAALHPMVAAEVAVYGMEHGSFSGAGLATYFNEKESNWVGARAIINGIDQAQTIALIGQNVYSAIGA